MSWLQPLSWWQGGLVGLGFFAVCVFVSTAIVEMFVRVRFRPRRGRIVLPESPWHVPVRFRRDRNDRNTFHVVYDRPRWRTRPMFAELRPGEELVVDRARHNQTVSVKFSSRH